MFNKQNSDNDHKIRVGITHGDFNGINYEVIIKTLMEPHILDICTPILYGSSKIASYYRKMLNVNDFNFNLIKKAEFAVAKRANIVNVTEHEIKIDTGESTEIAGQLAYTALEMAVDDLKHGMIDLVVTAPINKHNIQSADFKFKGHTEYFAERFNSHDYIMMMASDKFRIGFATGHIPLKDVAKVLTIDSLVKKLISFNNSLIRDFGIIRPRIALLSVNPHNGDSGVIGREETDILIPAIQKAANEKLLCFGPYPSDGFFATLQYRKFDGVMAMYHDQGMIPFKLLSFENGINFTAGLPIIRTSPAHGIAYEIAGKNEANPEPFRYSLFTAIDIFNNRVSYDKMNSNPLKYRNAPETYNESEDIKVPFDNTTD